jgi:hypothetical protein
MEFVLRIVQYVLESLLVVSKTGGPAGPVRTAVRFVCRRIGGGLSAARPLRFDCCHAQRTRAGESAVTTASRSALPEDFASRRRGFVVAWLALECSGLPTAARRATLRSYRAENMKKGCSGHKGNTWFRDDEQTDKGTLLESAGRGTEHFGRRARREWNNSGE